MKPNLYAIISRLVLDGVGQGIRNTESAAPSVQPRTVENLTENIHMAVMRELTEYFTFKDDDKQ